MAKIFANPHLPEIDDYYEPFDYDYEQLQEATVSRTHPTARPISKITGEKIDRIEWDPNWEDDAGCPFRQRSRDINMDGVEKGMLAAYENTFMLLPARLCEHCLNPTCELPALQERSTSARRMASS